jgi:membrane-bound metal-dependent hydrolase YbcI (DUF457 family)
MTFGLTLAACLIGIRIPDWIESGDRPGHRGFGHSLLSLFIFAFIALIVSGYFVDKDLAVLHAVVLAAGFLSYLVLDFVTYKGVPWFWPSMRSTSLTSTRLAPSPSLHRCGRHKPSVCPYFATCWRS